MEEVQPESPTRYTLPDQSSEEKSTCLIDYNSPATYPISTRKRKRVAKKKKEEKKPKIKKIKQAPEGKTFHEVPPVVENGEIVEVQVMEEGEIFDPDAFLDELAQQWHTLPPSTPQTSTEPFRNPSPPPRGSTEILYCFPVHLNDTLQKKESNTQCGHWKYYRCPVQNCFVSCGVDNVEHYLESAKRQLHNFYLAKPVHVMKCYCKRSLVMSLSQSKKNPGRLFLKCPKRQCNFFQWCDEKPQGKTKAWLEEGRVQEGYPRPRELFIPQQRDFQRQNQYAEKWNS